jgi:hypothetical protein
MRQTAFLLMLILFFGCKSEIDNILKNYPSALSPDKKAVVYQTSFKEDGVYRISLGTLIETCFAKGGAGIFDIQLDTVENLKFVWTSDTTLKVIYPNYAKVLRQKKQSYFAGRNIQISYEIEQKKSLFSEASIELNKPCLLVIELDSLELEAIKAKDGKDNFYTAADDLMWYNSQLISKMDSLEIPIKYFKGDSIKVVCPSEIHRIKKDSTFSIYTYFFFDGKRLTRKDLFDLL